jgi:hypothetical protein
MHWYNNSTMDTWQVAQDEIIIFVYLSYYLGQHHDHTGTRVTSPMY